MQTTQTKIFILKTRIGTMDYEFKVNAESEVEAKKILKQHLTEIIKEL